MRTIAGRMGIRGLRTGVDEEVVGKKITGESGGEKTASEGRIGESTVAEGTVAGGTVDGFCNFLLCKYAEINSINNYISLIVILSPGRMAQPLT